MCSGLYKRFTSKDERFLFMICTICFMMSSNRMDWLYGHQTIWLLIGGTGVTHFIHIFNQEFSATLSYLLRVFFQRRQFVFSRHYQTLSLQSASSTLCPLIIQKPSFIHPHWSPASVDVLWFLPQHIQPCICHLHSEKLPNCRNSLKINTEKQREK